MVVKILKKVIMFLTNKVISINENVKKVGNFLTAADKSFTYATKIVGTIPGVGRVSKGSIDFLKEVARRKGMYVTTSHDGVYTDPSSCFGCIHF